jgi:hypothetical protein
MAGAGQKALGSAAVGDRVIQHLQTDQ